MQFSSILQIICHGRFPGYLRCTPIIFRSFSLIASDNIKKNHRFILHFWHNNKILAATSTLSAHYGWMQTLNVINWWKIAVTISSYFFFILLAILSTIGVFITSHKLKQFNHNCVADNNNNRRYMSNQIWFR